MSPYFSEIFLAYHSRLLLNFDMSDDLVTKISGLSPDILYQPRQGVIYPNEIGQRVFNTLNEVGFYEQKELSILENNIESPDFYISYLLNSSSIHEVVAKSNHCLKIFSPWVTLSLSRQNDRVIIYFISLSKEKIGFLFQGVLYCIAKVTNKILSENIKAEDIIIGISADQIPNASAFANQITTNIIFNTEYTYLSYPAYLFEANNQGYNPFIAGYFEKRLREIQEQYRSKDDFLEAVNTYFESRISIANGTLSSDDLAEQLGMSRATLYRKLLSRNMTFKELLDNKRKQYVLLLLRDKSLSMAMISDLLGYANVSTFYRAFKRWYKTSPSAFR